MATITIYSKSMCPYCDRAKDLLQSKNISFEEIRADLDPEQLNIMLERSKRRTFPQIFYGDHHIGGFDDLWELEQSGDLDKLISTNNT
ncbi:MAG: glutaredoxin 3 [Pseudomonadota bacterium]|nr:glutaredoxin 3 [Pseudomonadota bacterium]